MAYHNYILPVGIVAGVVGVLYALKKLPAGVQQAGQNMLKPITDAIYNGAQSVLPYAGVQYTAAGFVLMGKYVSPSYKLQSSFINAMELAHPDNKALMNKLLDVYDVIKPQYRHLIGAEINAEVLNR